LAVLVAGVLFHYLRKYIDHAMRRVLITVPLAAIVCVEIIFLGLFEPDLRSSQPFCWWNSSPYCRSIATQKSI
jgi:hypothetical protein